ncbi:MAG: AAA family ATPase [Bacteroidota bacterium]
MDNLLEQSETIISLTSTNYIRGLMKAIEWDYRLIAIRGARGIGKTTLIRQHLKQTGALANEALYVSLDDFYFTEHGLFELAKAFVKKGGRRLYVDEVHKYQFGNWAKEIKNIYDFLPTLQVVFTGSSILRILNEQADLSRRALIYEMQGLSFREYLELTLGKKLPVFELSNLLSNHTVLAKQVINEHQIKPYAHLQEYLTYGYYPFFLESKKAYLSRVREMLKLVIEIDLNYLPEYSITDHHKINRLLYAITTSIPFKPNISKLSGRIGLNRNRLTQYIFLLERCRLLNLLHSDRSGITTLQKPDKIYLENTNIMYALAAKNVQRGAIRETFVLNHLRYVHRTETPFPNQVYYPSVGDFLVDNIENRFTLEVGGKGKTNKQIKDVDNAYIVADDIEFGVHNKVPLWLFGFLY